MKEEADSAIGRLERLADRIPFFGNSYVQTKVQQRAEQKLFGTYGQIFDNLHWHNRDFNAGTADFRCRVGLVEFTAKLDFILTPNGNYAVLWPFADGTFVPVSSDTLNHLRDAIEVSSTVIQQAAIDKLHELVEAGLATLCSADEPAALLPAPVARTA